MTHRDTIFGFLGKAGGPVCDDCVSEKTGIVPRQTVNLNCRRMAMAKQIERLEAVICHSCGKPKRCSSPLAGRTAAPLASKLTAPTSPLHDLWHWEGNVQGKLVSWLAGRGWAIRSAADTAAKSAGKDIVAERRGETLWVSVKGYPTGTAKTNPSTQARHWFSHAVFDLVLYRGESDSASLAIGLPDGFVTYQKLAARVSWLRKQLPFTLFWVDDAGRVRSE